MDESQPQDEQDVKDEAPEQAPEETQEQVEKPVGEETTEAPVEETEEKVEEATQVDAPVPAPQYQDLQVGEDGTLDVNQLNQWGRSVIDNAKAITAKELQAERMEDKQWKSLYKKYPEIEGDKKIRDMIHKQRVGNIITGGKDDVMGAWTSIRKYAADSKQEGVKSAQESITRQKSANLESASTPNNDAATKSKNQELLDLSASRNRRVAEPARQELLKGMIERGEI